MTTENTSRPPNGGHKGESPEELRRFFILWLEQLERFGQERDRRYAEVNIEKEKALKIKETADLAALQLAREIQTYKDEKANELRSQINAERGLYVTQQDLKGEIGKIEAVIKPIVEYVQTQRGVTTGAVDLRTLLFSLAAFAFGLIGVVSTIVVLVT